MCSIDSLHHKMDISTDTDNFLAVSVHVGWFSDISQSTKIPGSGVEDMKPDRLLGITFSNLGRAETFLKILL